MVRHCAPTKCIDLEVVSRGNSFDFDFADGAATASLNLPFNWRPSGQVGIVLDTPDPFTTAILDNFQIAAVSDVLEGDFNEDGLLDAADINLLSTIVRRNANNEGFDLNGDELVNSDDLNEWVVNIKHTYYGDANLDGQFSTSDLVFVFQAGEYEDATPLNSNWTTGDWNADGDFSTGDLVLAFQAGGFEAGPRASVAAVPEPNGMQGWLGLMLLVGSLREASRLLGQRLY